MALFQIITIELNTWNRWDKIIYQKSNAEPKHWFKLLFTFCTHNKSTAWMQSKYTVLPDDTLEQFTLTPDSASD